MIIRRKESKKIQLESFPDDSSSTDSTFFTLRESSFNMTRGGGMKILRGASEIFRHPKGGL